MRLIVLALTAVLALSATLAISQHRGSSCGRPGQWLLPGQPPAPVAAGELIERMAARRVVLLGETHDSAEDHRWQLHTLAQLHARRPALALGLEMFPRRLQPVLDRWVAGELDEQAFLRQSEWETVWGYDARDYLPLFHYARMHRLPLLALNVDRRLPEVIGRLGWDAVPVAEREGLGRPAPPAADYREQLRRIYDHHPAGDRENASFERFIEAQTVWDRAMAEGIAAHLKAVPDALVVGILGAGHVRHGHGVAHQLRDLGIRDAAGLLTWDPRAGCERLRPGLADAVFVQGELPGNPPRLGVATEPVEGGLRITEVSAGSVAEATGLRRGDVILQIAGRPAKNLQVLRGVVQQQVPGTWLPLRIRRDGSEQEVVARFPPPG